MNTYINTLLKKAFIYFLRYLPYKQGVHSYDDITITIMSYNFESLHHTYVTLHKRLLAS